MLTHLPSGKFYIGSSGNIKARILDHRRLLIAGTHSNPNLNECYTCWDDFKVDFETYQTRDKAYDREEELLNYFHGQSLCCNIGRDPRSAFLGGMPDGTKQRLRLAHLGKTFDDKFKENCRIRMTGNNPSEETRKRMSAARTGVRVSPETIEKMREVKAGKAIVINGVRYRSYGEAVRTLGLSESTIRQRVANHSPIFASWCLAND
jgi:group I intron endonuclease